MTEQKTTDLLAIVDDLASRSLPPGPDGLAQVAREVGKLFGVDSDEVAILTLNAKAKTLKFIIPEKLAAVGTIPLSSTSTLAARTARERRPELTNNFITSRHATVFEGVPLGRDPAELIQKIMSAPIMDGEKVLGVVQISRKGRSSSDAGQDFTPKDLRVLTSISPALERFLKLCPGG
jgi:hypothetical protein